MTQNRFSNPLGEGVVYYGILPYGTSIINPHHNSYIITRRGLRVVAITDILETSEGETSTIDGAISFVLSGVGVLSTVAEALFFLPQMLVAIGMPFEAAMMVTSPIYVIVGFSIIEFARGHSFR